MAEDLKEIDQLEVGIEVEMEHVSTFDWLRAIVESGEAFPSDEDIATKIAQDHLKERKDYYDMLLKAEHPKTASVSAGYREDLVTTFCKLVNEGSDLLNPVVKKVIGSAILKVMLDLPERWRSELSRSMQRAASS